MLLDVNVRLPGSGQGAEATCWAPRDCNWTHWMTHWVQLPLPSLAGVRSAFMHQHCTRICVASCQGAVCNSSFLVSRVASIGWN